MPLQSLTAVALATADREYMFPSFLPGPLVTGVGFLSVTNHRGQLTFDFAGRPLVAGESEDRLGRWLDANLPSGLHAGFELAETHRYFDNIPYAALSELHRPNRRRKPHQIDLSVWSDLGPTTLADACKPLSIPTNPRDEGNRFFDHHLARPGAILKGLAIDCIAAFRLAVALAAEELRDGEAFRAPIETALMAWLADTELIGGHIHRGVHDPELEQSPVPVQDPEPEPAPAPVPRKPRRATEAELRRLIAEVRAAKAAQRGLTAC